MLSTPASSPDRAPSSGPSIEGTSITDSSFAPPVLLQYWQVLIRWKWLIFGIVLVALAMGLIATLLATPQYTATSRIEISREQKNVTNVQGLESGETGRDLEFYQTQYSLLEARSLADRVVRQLRLGSNQSFFEAHGVNLDENALFASNAGSRITAKERLKRDNIAAQLLLGHVSITPIRGSALIDISYNSGSPALSALISNAWTQQFIESSMDRRFASTADARQFLEGRLADLRVRLEQSERDLVNYAAQKGIVSLGRTVGVDGKTQLERTLVATDLEALNASLAQATADRITAESRARMVGKGGANSEALSNMAITQLRQKRAEIASEYAKLMVQFEPGYPTARALAEQIRVLDSSIAREESRVGTSRSSEFQEAAQRERQLSERVQSIKQRLDLQQRDSIQ